jgi:hypothetical protein
MAKSFTDEDDALLAELGVEVEVKKQLSRTPREERIVAGFEEISRFAEEHGQPPQHGEDLDIFERLYAVRLDRIRDLQECRDLLAPLDEQGLLAETFAASTSGAEDLEDDALLAELGVEVAKSTHRIEACPLYSREKGRRRGRQSRKMRRFFEVQAIVRDGPERTG